MESTKLLKADHEIILQALHVLDRIITGAGHGRELNVDRQEDLFMYARRYIQLLAEHIEKESGVLFDIADQNLSDEEDATVMDAFVQFEKTIVGLQTQRRWHDGIGGLISKYLHAVA